MNTTPSKIAGWILLVVGLSMIFWGVYSSYEIFTGKKQAPEIFSYESSKNLAESSDVENNKADDKKAAGIVMEKYQDIDQLNIQDLRREQADQIKEMIGEQLKNILPADSMSKIMNLTSWSIFAFILILAGSKIASLGIKLIK